MGFAPSLAGGALGSGLGALGDAAGGALGEAATGATGEALTGMTGELAKGTADILPSSAAGDITQSALTSGTSTGAQIGTSIGDTLGLPADVSAGIGTEASVMPSLGAAEQVAAAGGTPEAAATQATLESAPKAANAVADAAGMTSNLGMTEAVSTLTPGMGTQATGSTMGTYVPKSGLMDALGKTMGVLNTGADLANDGMAIAQAAEGPPDPAPTFNLPPPRMRPMVGSMVPPRRPMAPPAGRPFTPLRRY